MILEEIVVKYFERSNIPEDVENIAETYRLFENIKNQVFMVVVNYEKNQPMLENLPHKRFEDLAITYKVKVDCGNGQFGTIQIMNEHLKYWNITDDILHEWAEQNTCNVLPAKITPMEDIMRVTMLENGMPEEFVDEILESMPIEDKLFVISNEANVYGAVAMLNDNILSELASMFGSDVYILPSSTHECIALAADGHSAEELAQMVQSINTTQVKSEEQLSDNVYCYNAKEHRLSIANEENINMNYCVPRRRI